MSWLASWQKYQCSFPYYVTSDLLMEFGGTITFFIIWVCELEPQRVITFYHKMGLCAGTSNFLTEFAKAIYIDLVPWCIVMGHLRGLIFCHGTADVYRPRGGDGGRKSQ